MKRPGPRPGESIDPETQKTLARIRKTLPDPEKAERLKVRRLYAGLVRTLLRANDQQRPHLVANVLAAPLAGFMGPVLEGLFRALASPQEASRAGAHAALLTFGPHAFLHVIQAMFKSHDATFRFRAVGLLAELAPTLPAFDQVGVTFALLNRSVNDEDAAVRTAAELALQTLQAAEQHAGQPETA